MKQEQMTTAVGRPLPLCRWWLRTRPLRNAVQIGPAGIPAVVEFYVPFWAWPFELLHRLIFGRSTLAAASLLLALGIGGCADRKRALPGLGGDPFDIAVTVVETGADLAAVNWIDPKCEESPDAKLCSVWREKVMPSIDAAIDNARESYNIVRAGGDPSDLAAKSINQAMAALDDAVAIEGSQKARDIGRQIKSALVVLRNFTVQPAPASDSEFIPPAQVVE